MFLKITYLFGYKNNFKIFLIFKKSYKTIFQKIYIKNNLNHVTTISYFVSHSQTQHIYYQNNTSNKYFEILDKFSFI